MIDEDAVTGLTSNPSIFQKAIAGGGDYDEQIAELLETTDDPREIFFALAVDDVRDACDVLRPVWERDRRRRTATSRSRSTRRSRTTTDDDARAGDRRCTTRVDRPNVYIKIPATRRGPAGDRGLRSPRGISINITLIFSLERYRRGRRRPTMRGLARLVDRRRRPVEGRLGRVVLRLAARHRGRRAARGARQHRAAGQARRSPTRSSPTSTSRRPSPGRAGSALAAAGATRAAAALGLDLDQEPGLPRRACTSRS